MSTNFSGNSTDLSGWISQAEAARIQGVSRQAIHKLVRNGRLRTMRIGGRVLVHRDDLEGFTPDPPGRRTLSGELLLDRLKRMADSLDRRDQLQLLSYLHSMLPKHPVEAKLDAGWDLVLDALERAGELTIRMIRGVIAEAAFGIYVVSNLNNWIDDPDARSRSVDYLLRDSVGPIRVQVKLQRSEKGIPVIKNGYYDVETQRTKGGERGGLATRPYRFDEFDILAVSMKPSTNNWSSFFYSVASWLKRDLTVTQYLSTHQPVATSPNDDWTDDFLTCVKWFREGQEKEIQGSLTTRLKKAERNKTRRGKKR